MTVITDNDAKPPYLFEQRVHLMARHVLLEIVVIADYPDRLAYPHMDSRLCVFY